ncbi:hypothetical protein HPP92_018050 [Vanilla planifolia]|uniref:Uncharacterized protein n=1 Tax=Vanilla planifolia TaxID=51239 RepID=A0A835QGP9_VANPL|nr:hypothetical protein HPP92_018050 [Vanilla planifolia]
MEEGDVTRRRTVKERRGEGWEGKRVGGQGLFGGGEEVTETLLNDQLMNQAVDDGHVAAVDEANAGP